MIAQLDDDSIVTLCTGLDGRSCGLVDCTFEPRPNSYDHKRQYSLKPTEKGDLARAGVKLPIWDFVIYRDDGSRIRLHPQWSTMKVETYTAAGHDEPVQPPAKGLGQSDGPGTFKYYKDTGCQMMLRFDASKVPPRGTQANPKAVAKVKPPPPPRTVDPVMIQDQPSSGGASSSGYTGP